MKKRWSKGFKILLACCLLMALAACSKTNREETTEPEGSKPAQDRSGALDYNLTENWAYFEADKEKPVDVFLICPTVDMKDAYYMSLDNEKMRERFVGALNKERGLYEDSARMFAPYYRQASMNAYSLPEEESELWLKLAYRDFLSNPMRVER